MTELELVTQILTAHMPTISNVEIIKAHVHGRDKCPHFQIQFQICPEEPINLYPIKDRRYNNLLEKIFILPSDNSNTKIEAQINIQTFERSLQIMKES